MYLVVPSTSIIGCLQGLSLQEAVNTWGVWSLQSLHRWTGIQARPAWMSESWRFSQLLIKQFHSSADDSWTEMSTCLCCEEDWVGSTAIIPQWTLDPAKRDYRATIRVSTSRAVINGTLLSTIW